MPASAKAASASSPLCASSTSRASAGCRSSSRPRTTTTATPKKSRCCAAASSRKAATGMPDQKPMEQARELLRRYFGYKAFRPAQEPIIRDLLAGRDTVAIMPTGAGKSICFQIPALLLDGITLVISPLISLMKDQVDALTEQGV